jgi:nucleotide-binding universal stress UspA family protein
MNFEKVLFYTQFREMAFNCLEAVLELKHAGLKEVVLAHVIPHEDVTFVPYGGYLKEEAERIKETSRIRFEEWQKTIAENGVGSKIRIEVGGTNAAIIDIANEEKVDLIVTGRKKRTLLEKVYVGSHIIDLLRRTTVPTLMAKYMVHYEADDEEFTRVNDHIFVRPLLATDWSEPSQRARDALSAFKGVAEKVLVAHVIGAKISKGIGQETLTALRVQSEKRLDAYCRQIQTAGLAAESHLAVGRTVAEILKISREHKATMIVMGRTGKDWFNEYWLGGVSHRIAELSEVPVLIIP